MAVVELAGVTKAYEDKVAVNNLSLSIDAGQRFGLLGPNGAGKTSSIRMMMGITIPDSGQVKLFDKPFERKSLERVGYLPEVRDRLGAAAGDRRRPRQEDGRAFQGHAAKDSVHRHDSPRSRPDRDGRTVQRPRPGERGAAGTDAA